MSFDAIRWAMAQTIQKSSAKFLLVAMADCVNEKAPEMVCWPSVAHLSKTTSQDRKTVLAGMKYLAQAGFITDTGNKVGQTKQIAVFLLKTPEIGTISASEQSQISLETVPNFPCDETANSTEIGTVEESQIRDSTKTGTVPNFPSNSTVFPSEESQISLETVPKTGHGTSKEPVIEPVKEPVKARKSKSTDGLPDGFAEFWAEYPRKDAKTDAVKAWKQIKLDVNASQREPVMLGLAKWKTLDQWTKDGGKFIPHPASWLRGLRWTDACVTVSNRASAANALPADDPLMVKAAALPPEWWKLAGFESKWDAEGSQCNWMNYTEFRDRKRVAQPEGAAA